MKNFTIIIPHFTKAGTENLDRVVNSIPQRSDIEIIIVDNSPIPIKDNLYLDNPCVKIIYSDNSRGAGGARNVGLSKAHGKWILFADADDFFTSTAFNIFDSYRNSDYDIIFFKPTSCYPETNELATRHLVFCKEVDNYLKTNDEHGLRCCEFDVPWAKMFKGEFIVMNNFKFEEVPASNDVMFSLLTGLAAKKITACSEAVYCVTVTPGSITTTPSLRNLESIFEVKIRKNSLLNSVGYKRECSVANTILKSRKYGFKVFCRFLYRALITGNIFVGYDRWIGTIGKMLNSRC